jgi:preprotein translocase subunit YajC
MQVQNGTIPVFGLISAQTQPQAGGGIDIMTILLFVLLGLFVFMMFRRNKKTQQQQAQLSPKLWSRLLRPRSRRLSPMTRPR